MYRKADAKIIKRITEALEEKMIILKEESYRIIGAAMEVHSTLGCGSTEPVYQEALEIEFKKRGIPYEREKELHIKYIGENLNKVFRPDFVCFNNIIIELKAVTDITDEHLAQVYNYLKASGFPLGILINFGKTDIEFKRIPSVTKWQN